MGGGLHRGRRHPPRGRSAETGIPLHAVVVLWDFCAAPWDSGEQFTVRPGDAFHMPPGHDAWTEGKEACVLIDVTGVKNYAKPA